MISMNYRFNNGKVLTPTGQPIQYYLRDTFMDCFAGSDDYDHYPVVDKNGMLMKMESICIKKERLARADAKEL